MQIFESQFNKSCSRVLLAVRWSRGGFRLTTVNLGTMVIDILFRLLIIQIQHMIYRSAKMHYSTSDGWLHLPTFCNRVCNSEMFSMGKRLVCVNRLFWTELNLRFKYIHWLKLACFSLTVNIFQVAYTVTLILHYY